MSHTPWCVARQMAYLLCFGLLLSNCAQPRLPTGGPKDTIPPQLLHSIPEPGTLNYSKKSITLVFDEWIGEHNLRSKLLITPQPKERNPYKLRIRKNRIVISFEHALDSNKTYTISLEDGIIDLTERNPVQGLQLSFSTGPEIDSLALDGRVEWAKKGKPAKEALIYLVSGEEDSLHFSERKPIYINRSNKEGVFSFTHLSKGVYRLLAFIDKNKNQVINIETEAYAFSSDTIKLDQKSITESYTLALVELDGSPFKFIGSRAQNIYHEAFYNKDLKTYHVYSDQPLSSPLYSHITKKGKSIRFYRNSTFKIAEDSLRLYIKAKDQQNNQRIDTIQLSFNEQAFTKESSRKKAGALVRIRDKRPAKRWLCLR